MKTKGWYVNLPMRRTEYVEKDMGCSYSTANYGKWVSDRRPYMLFDVAVFEHQIDAVNYLLESMEKIYDLTQRKQDKRRAEIEAIEHHLLVLKSTL